MFKFIINYFKETEVKDDAIESVIKNLLKKKPMLDPLNQLPLDKIIKKSTEGKYYKACFRAPFEKIQKAIPLESLKIIKQYEWDDVYVKFLKSEYDDYFNSNVIKCYTELEKFTNKLQNTSIDTKAQIESKYNETFTVIKDAFKDLHKLNKEDISNIYLILKQISEDIEEYNRSEISSVSDKLKFEVEYLNKMKQARQEMKDLGFE